MGAPGDPITGHWVSKVRIRTCLSTYLCTCVVLLVLDGGVWTTDWNDDGPQRFHLGHQRSSQMSDPMSSVSTPQFAYSLRLGLPSSTPWAMHISY